MLYVCQNETHLSGHQPSEQITEALSIPLHAEEGNIAVAGRSLPGDLGAIDKTADKQEKPYRYGGKAD